MRISLEWRIFGILVTACTGVYLGIGALALAFAPTVDQAPSNAAAGPVQSQQSANQTLTQVDSELATSNALAAQADADRQGVNNR